MRSGRSRNRNPQSDNYDQYENYNQYGDNIDEQDAVRSGNVASKE